MTDWNKPDTKAALVPWLLIDPLTLYQAVMLIFGRDPSHELTGKPVGFVPIMAALIQAIHRHEIIPASWKPDAISGATMGMDTPVSLRVLAQNRPLQDHEIEECALLRQADIREWLRKIGRTDAFFFLVEPNDWQADSAYGHWSKMATWTLREALNLSCGLAGDAVPGNGDTREDLNRRGELAKRAVKANELEIYQYNDERVFDSSVRPDTFLSWAVNTFDTVPDELVELVKSRGKRVADLQALANMDFLTAECDRLRAERDNLEKRADKLEAGLRTKTEQWMQAVARNGSQLHPEADKPLSERERNTLLRIIRALDEMAKLPARGAAPSVEKQLQNLGFNSPKDATIRERLDEARALEPDGKT